jgi:16S rRNA (cytidine1402-2'-O)-methyltransferase
MKEVLGGERQLVIARELTKTFETIHRCLLQGAEAWFREDANRQRGEFVLIVEPALPVEMSTISEEATRILKLLLAELPLNQAAKLAAGITGIKKNALYDHALQLQENDPLEKS